MPFSLNWRSDFIASHIPAHRSTVFHSNTRSPRALYLCLLISSLVLALLPGQAAIASGSTTTDYPEFGAMPIVGEALEPCESTAQIPTAKVLDNSLDWQAALAAGQPGDTFLLRGGLYQTQEPLELPAGAPDRPITVKPYNCEAVTLYTALRPRSYNIIAGLHLENQGLLDNDAYWVILVTGKRLGHVEQVIIRHNTIWGGTMDAIRVSDDTAHVRITGNQIDGGGNGHAIFITAEAKVLLPDQIEVSNNLLTKAYYKTPSEDMFQARDVRNVTFSHNTCTNGYAMEQCVDIKSTQAALVISHNLFDGDQLHLGAVGEDTADGCMVIHETDGDPQPHLIDHNLFRNCKGTVIRFAAAMPEHGEISSAIVQDNLITSANVGEGEIPVFQARNVEFNHNTLINAHIKLGDAAQSRTPQNTTFRNNIIYQTSIDDHASSTGTAVACRHNLLYEAEGRNFDPNTCTNSTIADPLFVDPAAGNFEVQPDSPLHSMTGDDGRSLGAAIQNPALATPVATPTATPSPTLGKNQAPQLYLPLLRN